MRNINNYDNTHARSLIHTCIPIRDRTHAQYCHIIGRLDFLLTCTRIIDLRIT